MSDVAMRKRRQRELEEMIKSRLIKVLNDMFPHRLERNVRKRKRIDTELLLRNSIACVKEKLSSSDAGGQGSATIPPAAVPECMYRQGMLSSSTMGVLLVRVEDLEIIESSAAVSLFCPHGPL
eukprot:CAMPEP_0173394032 /NCGR_PEP_ID=MMETSP1356-20130122/24123_1 /TAXON_ID=77927 ORGANISM="Hemiselmis virescens, Strain PCC157" /NCGR_SAMPLE_ID=MMETSP1356 /ASSEMBLY_ACC=CAM_ASM_000847 /LENGTH=122 /DNA_ID=CAMNT_0014352193 /DNA_START=1 /DNA_END=366 /DNA_ORIENTATION=+